MNHLPHSNLTPCYPLTIPLLPSCYPLSIVAQNNIQTNGSDIQIFKFVNYCRFIIKKYKTVLSKKRDFYNKKILSVRFCGLFLHRNWRTRGFRKPVTVEHFQLN
jgi:hypothetical protein